jgi:Retinal pigment epithelial membrane protein
VLMAEDRADLIVIDAATMTELARLHLPQRVPFGVHATWLATTDLASIGACLLPDRNRPANRAATCVTHTDAIKRLKQKRMLPRFSPRFVFVLKWSAIYASLDAIVNLSGASFTAATSQDGAALGFSRFSTWGRDHSNYARGTGANFSERTKHEQDHNHDHGRRGYRARWSPTPSTRR